MFTANEQLLYSDTILKIKYTNMHFANFHDIYLLFTYEIMTNNALHMNREIQLQWNDMAVFISFLFNNFLLYLERTHF